MTTQQRPLDTCKVDSCDRTVSVKASRLCNTHYMRFLRNGTTELLPREPRPAEAPGPCRVDGCDKPVRVKSSQLCGMHYGRFLKHGSTELGERPEMERETCKIDGCGSYVFCKGVCEVHYGRFRRTGSYEPQPKTSDSMCSFCGTRFAVYSDGRCRPCKQKLRRGADHVKGICQQCGAEYETARKYADTSNRGRFCSPACKAAERIADGRAAEAVRRSNYKRKYGLTVEQVEEMRSKGCAICGAENGEDGHRWGNLHIDHDHVTGKVRGVLCASCNLGLGKFQDDPAILQAAIDYLAGALVPIP